MDEKICPIHSPHPNTPYADRDTRCIRERCAWWCSYPYSTTEEKGVCAITDIAYNTNTLAQKASFDMHH